MGLKFTRRLIHRKRGKDYEVLKSGPIGIDKPRKLLRRGKTGRHWLLKNMKKLSNEEIRGLKKAKLAY